MTENNENNNIMSDVELVDKLPVLIKKMSDEQLNELAELIRNHPSVSKRRKSYDRK